MPGWYSDRVSKIVPSPRSRRAIRPNSLSRRKACKLGERIAVTLGKTRIAVSTSRVA
jgi:hypothetical protein